jgi:8-oxo-dGTP pyrophosphatase MutT (NUDIX family)
MTKRRSWSDPNALNGVRQEKWIDTAARAAAECTGDLCRPVHLLDIPKHQQSDRDGRWKRYSFSLHGIFVPAVMPLAPGVIGKWLAPDDFLEQTPEAGADDLTLRPISQTARFLIRVLQAEKRDLFLRRSAAAVALIRTEQAGQTRWLAQWNDKWGRFFFVSGHKRADESFRECMIRELQEELGLGPDADFTVPEAPRATIKFADRSESAQCDTYYEFAAFDVRLTERAVAQQVNSKPENRWLTEQEIHAEQCEDGRAVSGTMRILLEQLHQAGIGGS